MDLHFYAIAALAVVFAGVAKGGFGGGPAFVGSAILALVTTPTQAIGLMLPLLLVMDAAVIPPFWKRWDWARARVMIIGGIPGILIGAAFYTVTNDNVLRFLIGAISIGFVIWHLWPTARRDTVSFSPTVGFVAGVASGFTSFVSHAGGPPAAIYLLSQRLDKTPFHATMCLVFAAVNALKVVPYAFLGIFTIETLLTDLALVPFALLGIYLGIRAHHVIPEKLFFRLIYVILVVAGAKLISDALL